LTQSSFFLVKLKGKSKSDLACCRQGGVLSDLYDLHPTLPSMPDDLMTSLKSLGIWIVEEGKGGPPTESRFDRAVADLAKGQEEKAFIGIELCLDTKWESGAERTLSFLLRHLNGAFDEVNGILLCEDGFLWIAPDRPINQIPQLLPLQRAHFSKLFLAAGLPEPSSVDRCDLSIVIPTRDRADLLLGYFDRMLEFGLTDYDLEHVIVDDGSTDKTGEVVPDYGQRFPELKIKYFRQDPTGPGAARNLGVRQACGRLIAFWGDDFRPSRDLIGKHLDFHRNHPIFGSAMLGPTQWSDECRVTPFMKYILSKESGGAQFANEYLVERYSNRKIEEDTFFYTSNVSLRRGFLLRYGLFYSDIFPAAMLEDIEMGVRLGKVGLGLFFNSQAVGYHKHEITLESFFQREQRYRWYFKDFCRLHPDLFEYNYPLYSSNLAIDKKFIAYLAKALARFEDQNRETCSSQDLKPIYRSVLDLGSLSGIALREEIVPATKLPPTIALLHTFGLREQDLKHRLEMVTRNFESELKRIKIEQDQVISKEVKSHISNERKAIVAAVRSAVEMQQTFVKREQLRKLEAEWQIKEKDLKQEAVARCSRLEKALQERADREKEELTKELIRKAKEERLNLEKELRLEAHQEIDKLKRKIVTSLSWRITKPCRAIGRIIKGEGAKSDFKTKEMGL